MARTAAPTGRKPAARPLSLRSHYWGAVIMVVATGDLEAEAAERLDRHLRRVQLESDVIVDLWDVSRCDHTGVATIEEAKARAEAAGWGFAVLADPNRACAQFLETYADRHEARAALYE